MSQSTIICKCCLPQIFKKTCMFLSLKIRFWCLIMFFFWFNVINYIPSTFSLSSSWTDILLLNQILIAAVTDLLLHDS